MENLAKCVLVAVCCAMAGPALAQEPNDNVLTLGQAETDSLAADGKAKYVVDLEAGHFVYGEVNQHDVDVRVTVIDPGGDIAGSFDGSKRGAEPVQLETDSAGRYRIEIAPSDEQSGSFTIALERIEPVAADPAKRLDQLLSAFAGDDVPGAVVAVTREGHIIHSQAVGMANLSHGIPFKRETVSNLGSVSKQFTAFAVTKLASSGDLALDDDVRQYFPELPDMGQTVTIRHLLNHTSGYREILNLLSLAGVRLGKGDYVDRGEIIRILQRQPTLQEQPGTTFNYNNTAYGLAALLIERMTDVPFDRWMADNVFAPLEMTRTRVRSSEGEIIPNASDGYVYAEESPFRQTVDLGGGGGLAMGPGAIYTTVDDMALWIDNLHTAKVGGPEVIGEMTRPQIEAPGKDTHYGFGLSIERYRGLKLLGHSGGDTAHRAQMLFFPELNAGVIAMSNNGAFDPGSIARHTADAFFAEHLEAEEEAEQVALAGDGAEPDAPHTDSSVFEPHLGKYELDDYPGVILTVSREDQQLYVQFSGSDPQPVSPQTEKILKVPPDTTIEFHLAKDGRADSVTINSSRVLTAQRLADWAPAYAVEMGENGLLIKHRRLDDMELLPKVPDSFSGSFPIAEVAFSRDEDGNLKGMMVSNVRTRNIWFAKQK
jgi:CubicO group peptidase (beta-lactamase class C family)